MKRLLLALLLFSSPVLAEEDRIYYVHVRPPSSYSGTIGDDGFFYYFTNSAVSASKDGSVKIWAMEEKTRREDDGRQDEVASDFSRKVSEPDLRGDQNAGGKDSERDLDSESQRK